MNHEATQHRHKKKKVKRERRKSVPLFDGYIPLSSEKGNRGFRGGRQRGTSDLTSAHMCVVGVTERRPSIMSRAPAGRTEHILSSEPRRPSKGLRGKDREVAAGRSSFMFHHSHITVAPLGHAGTRLPSATLVSDWFSHPVFQLQMVSDYKDT